MPDITPEKTNARKVRRKTFNPTRSAAGGLEPIAYASLPDFVYFINSAIKIIAIITIKNVKGSRPK